MKPLNNKETTANKVITIEMYDLYAPAVYGKILSIVHKGPIAHKILEKIFATAFKGDNIPTHNSNTPLISLLNQSREKSYKTIKALNIFSECCAGTSVHITDKK